MGTKHQSDLFLSAIVVSVSDKWLNPNIILPFYPCYLLDVFGSYLQLYTSNIKAGALIRSNPKKGSVLSLAA